MDFNKGDIVRFVEATDAQVNWGSNDDPREHLLTTTAYTVVDVEVHSFHTKIVLEGFEDLRFNSVHFELVRRPG